MAFPEAFLEELVRRNDIVDVVSGYVRLTKKSGSNLFGLCPFHSEKTPSFAVSPDKQIFHCFGCGRGGGVIGFIMEIENLSYPDAVHLLARRCGLEVPDDRAPKETQSRRARLLELNREAARFFYTVLKSPQGEAARRYILKRGISNEMVKRFGLGAAPDSWDALCRAMAEKGFSRQELLDAGLARAGRKESGGIYDTFRNRLMFPVIDVRGSVVGFSGRILGDGEPKYLNTPDTPVFDKSRNLFALNIAKKSKSGVLILAEGNIDVVALHQAGFDGAVASLGTSLTEEQARLMARYAKQVVIAFDSDEAGLKAAQRAIGILEKTGLAVKVLRLQGAKDPDEFISRYGRDAFAALLERSEGHVDYRLKQIASKYDLKADEGRVRFVVEAAEMLAGLDSAAEREVYGAKVAEMSGVSAEAVGNEVRKAAKRLASADRKRLRARELNVKASVQPADRSIRYENEYSAVAEEGVIRLLVLDGTLFRVAEEMGLDESEFTSPFLAKVFAAIRSRRDMGLDSPPALILAGLEKAEASHLSAVIQKPESLANGEKAMRDYINKIRAEKLRKSAQADPVAALRTLTER